MPCRSPAVLTHFDLHTERRGEHVVWTGGGKRPAQGAHFTYAGVRYNVRHLAWEWEHGVDLDDLYVNPTVRVTCGEHACVLPAHLAVNRFTRADEATIRERYLAGETGWDLARAYDVNPVAISAIVAGLRPRWTT